MTYRTENYNGADVEVFIPCRIVRIKLDGRQFKFFAQTEGTVDAVIYIGHGELNSRIKTAIKLWAESEGIKVLKWGSEKDPIKSKIVA